MLFRSKNGKLYSIKKADYLTEKDYYTAIMSVKYGKGENKNKGIDSKTMIKDIIRKSMSK